MDAQGAHTLANAVASVHCNIAVLYMDCNPKVGHQGVIDLSSIALKRTSCPITTLRIGNVGLRRKRCGTSETATQPAKTFVKRKKDSSKIYTKYFLPSKERKAKETGTNRLRQFLLSGHLSNMLATTPSKGSKKVQTGQTRRKHLTAPRVWPQQSRVGT